jgi:isopentenyldiphosphate isomerase
MDNEMVDILNEKGNPIGEIKLKREVHAEGLWHRAVQIWIYNSKGEILLQKRSKNKEFFPRLLDMSAAGHVSAGETFEEAAVRELFQEIGLRRKASDLKNIGTWPLVQYMTKPFYNNKEIFQVFLLKWDGNIKELKLQKKEVEMVKFVPIDTFESELKDPEKVKKYIPHGDHYFRAIEYIKKEIGRD